MSKELNQKNCESALNGTFKVKIEGEDDQELTLAEVKGGNAPSKEYESFSLLFKGSKGRSLHQQIYTMENDKLGEVSIFIVPVGGDEENYEYQAVFNREKK